LAETKRLLSIFIAISIIIASSLTSPLTLLPKAYSQNDTNYGFEEPDSDVNTENMVEAETESDLNSDGNNTKPEASQSQSDEINSETGITDNQGNPDSGSDNFQAEVNQNSPPIADAGPDLEVNEHTSVVLDGTKSSDSDGYIVGFRWEQNDNMPLIDLKDSDSPQPSFLASDVDSDQQFNFRLEVTDNNGDLDSDIVRVLVMDSISEQNRGSSEQNPSTDSPRAENMTSSEQNLDSQPETTNETNNQHQELVNDNESNSGEKLNQSRMNNMTVGVPRGNLTNLVFENQSNISEIFPFQNDSNQNTMAVVGPNETKPLDNLTIVNGTDTERQLEANETFNDVIIDTNVTLPNLNKTEVGFQNGTVILNATLPIFNFPEIRFENVTFDVGNLTGIYYENGTVATYNDTQIPLSNGTLLSLNNTNLSPFQNIIATAGPIYSQSLADIQTVRDIASTIQSIGGLAGGLKLLHFLTCNTIIKISCIPFPLADDTVDFVLNAIKDLSEFLKNYNFDKSIYVFQSGKDLISQLDGTNDTKGLARLGINNGEAIQWMTALNGNFWVKSSRGFAATIGDVLIFAGKIDGDESWIQTGQKIKSLHDDLVTDSSSLLKIQKMIKSYLGQQNSPEPKLPSSPKGPIQLPPIIIKPKTDAPPHIPTKSIVKEATNKVNGPEVKKKTTTITTTTTESPFDSTKPRLSSYATNYIFVTTIGSFGRGPGQLNHPASIDMDPNGQRIYVADLDNNRIQVLHRDGSFITEWGTLGSGRGQFNNPGALAVDDDHKVVFVADIKNNRIEKFDIQGKYLGQWGTLGKGDGQFDHPGDIALDPDKEILYVTDIYNNRVQAFYYDGNFITKWGSFGNGNGQFNRPAGITINTKGDVVYVSDTANNRIQVFDTDGNFMKKWGSLGSGNGQFARPDGIFFEPSEKVMYVADRQNHRIQVFDDQGAFITGWTTSASETVKPRDVVLDSSGQTYVVDKENNNILLYKVSTSPFTELNVEKQKTKTQTTKTTTTSSQEQPTREQDGKSHGDLSVSIEIAKNPITRGNVQSITVKVTDSVSKKSVKSAQVEGSIDYVSSHVESFSGKTDSSGKVTHSWRISGNASPGEFDVNADVSASGYDDASEDDSFKVQPKG
jgi:DNA-binding beta-propeller fold protein YncE